MYRELKARAARAEKTIGEMVNEAIRCYLGRPGFGKRHSLDDLIPEEYPADNERLSDEIDRIMYSRTSEAPRGRAVIVLDSSFLIAYHNWRDAHHDAAVPVMHALKEKVWGQAPLLEYVFLKVVTVVLVRRNLAAASRVASTLLGARELNFVPAPIFFLKLWRLFAAKAPPRSVLQTPPWLPLRANTTLPSPPSTRGSWHWIRWT